MTHELPRQAQGTFSGLFRMLGMSWKVLRVRSCGQRFLIQAACSVFVDTEPKTHSLCAWAQAWLLLTLPPS